MAKNPEVRSACISKPSLAATSLQLTRLNFTTGKSTRLLASGSLNHFANPQWQVAVDGSLELKQLSLLAGVDGLNAGIADFNIRGHNCSVAPAVAQKRLPFWRRRHPQPQTPPSVKVLPPDPDCVAGYLVAGEMKLHKVAYSDPYVRLHDIDGSGHLRITPTDLLLTTLTGYLPGGGRAEGDLRIANWLGEAPANARRCIAHRRGRGEDGQPHRRNLQAPAPVTNSLTISKVQPAHAYLTATTYSIPLRAIMDVTAPNHYGDLGFDTAVSGPVKVEWGGPATDVADTVQVDGNLTFAPTGVKRSSALENVPVWGQALAHYDGKTEVVRIQKMQLQSLRSTLNGAGVLGVNIGDPLTALHVDFTVHDLSEYDQLLRTLAFEANGKKGTDAIPVVLHGALEFQGVASGPIADLDLKGHLQGSQVEVKLGTTIDAQFDSIAGDGEFSPYNGLALLNSTIKRGTAVLNVAGSFRPRKVVSPRHIASYEWDDGMRWTRTCSSPTHRSTTCCTSQACSKNIP